VILSLVSEVYKLISFGGLVCRGMAGESKAEGGNYAERRSRLETRGPFETGHRSLSTPPLSDDALSLISEELADHVLTLAYRDIQVSSTLAQAGRDQMTDCALVEGTVSILLLRLAVVSLHLPTSSENLSSCWTSRRLESNSNRSFLHLGRLCHWLSSRSTTTKSRTF